ncbi:MAG: B12-binding domain-containing radical SAM protein [Desulfatibacillum sp.]|nr:B12-binding domain-containing radical SAM protein [Desulfatibacillum sp.]
MADAVLIYPYIGDMDVVRDKPHLPLGLIQTACLAAQHFDITLIDLRVQSDWQSILKKELAARPLFVGLSVMSGQPVARAWTVSRFVKESSDTPVLWGGNHPSLSPGETLGDPNVDMVVIGDGEETLLETMERLDGQKSLKGVNGLWFKEGAEIVRNELRPPVDLDTLPPPPYHLVNVEDYIQEYRGKRMVNLETSRGCAHHCRYCYHTSQSSNHRFRAMGVEQSLKRMFWARDTMNVDGVYLVDDNFFLDRKRGLAIVEALKSQSRQFYWQIQGVDVPSMLGFNNSQLGDLEKSGLQRVSVGAESGSPRVLNYVQKPHTVPMLLQANKLWSPFDINIFYSWLSGLPGETLEDLKKTVGVMFRILKDNPHARLSPIYNFLPFPGTSMWDEVINNHGFQPPKNLKDWGNYDWSHVNVAYLDPGLKRTLDNLYFPSLCLDRKFDDFPAPWWLRWGVRLYRPLAKARMKTLYAGFPAERAAAAVAERILAAGNRVRTPWTL